MEKKKQYYQIIKDILSQIASPPYNREEIKAEIESAIGGHDYMSAVIDYLWVAYYNCDPAAKMAFEKIFSDDLRARNPELFQFFSFYFNNSCMRRGFDRRLGADRRGGYALDDRGNIIENRSGRERRNETEKRLDWTRVDEWVSVPFKLSDGHRKEKIQDPEGDAVDGVACSFDAEQQTPENLKSLNVILSCLISYFENYMQPGQTAWMGSVNRETFDRATQVMRNLIEISAKGWPTDAS